MKNITTDEKVITKAIKKRIIKIPSDLFLFNTIGAMPISLTLNYLGRSKDAEFLGGWVAPFSLWEFIKSVK